MYQNKRTSESNEISTIESKRSRTRFNQDKNKMTCIEDLSTEIFYELFEYLDGIDIYKAFSKLNFRFQDLLMNSSFPLKIKFNSLSNWKIKYYGDDIIVPNRHQICSLYFGDEQLIQDLFTYCVIDSSFERLQSIFIDGISLKGLAILLFYFKSLPQLCFLTVVAAREYVYNLSWIYRMIFSLPTLKYNNLWLSSPANREFKISLPLAINEKFSNIEHLFIEHNCTLDQLYSMLYRTPKLHRLSCQILLESNIDLRTKQSLTLSNLVYLSIGTSQIGFDAFEMFMVKISARLQVLNIKQDRTQDYFDGERWEQLIKRYIPNLRTFNYEYRDLIKPDDGNRPLYLKTKSFNSFFWIERQHLSEVQIMGNDLVYSVYPYRKLCSDIYKQQEIATQFNQTLGFKTVPSSTILSRQDNNISSSDFVPPIQLRITDLPATEQNHLFILKLKSMFDTVRFTRLNINCSDIPIGLLSKIIHMLPNLDSLKVSSLPIMHRNWSFDNDSSFYYLTSIRNKITKLNLENITDIEQVHFMIYSCTHVQYLQINVSPNMYLDILLRFILLKANTHIPQLRLLCLTMKNISEETLHYLQTMVHTENLLVNYTIKRFANHIVVEWTRS